MTRDEASPVLRIEALSKHFGGARALDAVDFEVRPGEVHGLLGQNGSGKSTLIKILAGFHEPDAGATLFIGGLPVPLPIAPGSLLRLGISFVHQHLGLVPSMTVLENLLIGTHAARQRWAIRWRDEAEAARALFGRFGLDFDPGEPVERLSSVNRAMLAIVRAYRQLETAAGTTARILVLDEPTPFLPAQDVALLFRLVRTLVGEGASVIFVSHDIDEVMEITDRATVLRDGRVAGTFVTASVTKSDIVRMIVGRAVDLDTMRAPARTLGPEKISIRGLSGPTIRDLDLTLRAGEVVGFTGLIGSGYDEAVQMAYGARRASAGSLRIGQRTIALPDQTPDAAIAARCVYVPADRLAAGAIANLPVTSNVTLPVLDRSGGGWLLRFRDLRAQAARLAETYDVRPRDPARLLGTLSGGNQQKVVLAKWFQIEPELILLDEPTQGVDIGAREQVFGAIRAMSAGGACVICASSDHEQLAALCDRVLVFSRGRVVASLEGAAISKAAIAENCYRTEIGMSGAAA